jgi:hypothetical protein
LDDCRVVVSMSLAKLHQDAHCQADALAKHKQWHFPLNRGRQTYLACRRRKGAARGLGEGLSGSEHDDYNWQEATVVGVLVLVVEMAEGILRSEVLFELPQR